MGIKENILGKTEYCLDCGIKVVINDGAFGDSKKEEKAVEYREGYRCNICDKRFRANLERAHTQNKK